MQGERKLIEISSEVKGGKVEISFANSGQPIPDNYLREIFDPFFTTKDPGVGTGLGLSVCYSIVMAHGGEIDARNLENGMVQFRISLPYEVAPSEVLDASIELPSPVENQ